jgi:hypothetical protein
MVTYEFWRHSGTGEVFAVQLLDGVVVGCSGPLHHDDIDPAFLEDLDYAEEGAAAIEATREEYALLEAV